MTRAAWPTLASRPQAVWYQALTARAAAEVVQEYFSDRAPRTERFELPNLHALNFLLHGALGKGGTSTLRLDPQGKALADAICFLEIELTDEEAALLGAESRGKDNHHDHQA